MSFELPVQNGNVIQMTPVGVSLTRSVNASLSSSTEITLHEKTTFVRLYAISKDVYLRWGVENCNASTFDEVIVAGQYLDLMVPFDEFGIKYTAFNVIQREASATLIVIEK